MPTHFDCLVIGGGPGGSTLATHLVQAGWNVGLLEREVFPRFRIGESLLPYSMPIFKKTGFFKILDGGKYIRKYGAQFIDGRHNKAIYFRFDGDNADAGEPFAFEVDREMFDTDLLAYAKAEGVTVLQPEQANDVVFETGRVRVITNGGEYTANYVADATGRMSFLGNKLKLRVANADLNNVAVFAQYRGVQRNADSTAGDIVIAVLGDQSWSWTIPFQGDRTSVGVVTNAAKMDKRSVLDDYVETRLAENELFHQRMVNAVRINDVRVVSNYSHTCETVVGDRWISVGDAGMFLDPIFSSGVHLSVTGATLAAEVLQRAARENMPLSSPQFQYEKNVRKGVRRFHWIIRMFYDTDFVGAMEKVMDRTHLKQAFTAIVAGDVWNDDNVAFKMNGL
jgi:flavin-dependent dehydrogenase